jgi:hypothetical protein
MQQRKSFFLFGLALWSLAHLLSGCASLTGFQDGRTLGEGNSELMASLNFSQSPNFNKLEDEEDSLFVDVPTLLFPSMEAGFAYGVHERVNVQVRMNTNLNLGVGAKVQLLGDRESLTALSVGAEVATFGLGLGLWNVQLPVFFSVHPTEIFSWYLSPRYIYQFSSYANASDGLSYIGGNTGLLFGRRHKFGIDVGYYHLGGFDASLGLLQIGVGGRFAIGK